MEVPVTLYEREADHAPVIVPFFARTLQVCKPGLLLTTISRLLLVGTLTTDAYEVPLSNSTSYEVAPDTEDHTKLKVEPVLTDAPSAGDNRFGVPN